VSTAVAAVLLLAVVAYAIFAGADFGAGFWDLTAGGPERGEHPRNTIEHSIGPVWEANHVWLIFIFVILWTSFPEAYASITLTLFVPLTIAALGIVLRGASFAFRKAVMKLRDRRLFGAGFAASSVLVPYCMGAIAGGIASAAFRRVARRGSGAQLDQSDLDPLAASWLWPPSRTWRGLSGLGCSAARGPGMVEYFRRRASLRPALSRHRLVGIFVLRADAPYLFQGLASRRCRL
jgi:cytochrome d ubiquinol oxidase subunit II